MRISASSIGPRPTSNGCLPPRYLPPIVGPTGRATHRTRPPPIALRIGEMLAVQGVSMAGKLVRGDGKPGYCFCARRPRRNWLGTCAGASPALTSTSGSATWLTKPAAFPPPRDERPRTMAVETGDTGRRQCRNRAARIPAGSQSRNIHGTDGPRHPMKDPAQRPGPSSVPALRHPPKPEFLNQIWEFGRVFTN